MFNRFLSRNLWFFYILFWIALAAIQFVLLVQNYRMDPWLALSESLVFTSLFAIMGIGLKFMIQFSGRSQRTWFETISFHLTAAAFAILLWLGLGRFILRTVAAGNPEYLEFLDNSMSIRILAGVLIYSLQLTVFYLLMNIKELQDRIKREASLTAMLREAELNKLRAQIKPHFLFNSLNSVSSLTISDPARAQEMVIKLSEFMRYSLSMAEESMSTLKNELYHAGLYLDIEKVRFSDRLRVVETIEPGCENWPIPAMILQPLLENAVKHGVYTLSEPSDIRLEINCENGFLKVKILNSFDPETAPRRGTGTGLQNVIQRMNALYSRPDLVELDKQQSTFSVVIRFPHAVVEG